MAKSAADLSGSLTARSLRAAKWNYLGVLVRVISQVVAQVALARLLGPDSFGLFGFALLLFGIASIIAEAGMGSALVQKHEIDNDDVRFVFTRVVMASVGVALALYAFAPLFAIVLNDSRITDVARGIAPALVLQAFAITPMSLLRRDMAFKAIQLAHLTSYLIGFVAVGLVLAANGAGVWSLVAAWIAQSACLALILFYLRPHAVTPRLRLRQTRMNAFAWRVLLTNLANWVMENVDNLLVGKYFGSQALGLYSVAYNLVRSPANHLMGTLQSVLFSASSRAQSNQIGIQRAYLTVVSAVTLISFPLFSGMAVISDTVVAALFGDHWLEAGALLLPLSLSMVAHTAMTGSVVLWGTGMIGKELRVQIFTLALLIVALSIAAQYSLLAIAWTVFAVYLLRAIWLISVVMKAVNVSIWAVAEAARGGAILAGLSAAALLMTDGLLKMAHMPLITRFVLDLSVGAIALAGCTFLFSKYVIHESLQPFLAAILKRLSVPKPT